MASVEPLRLVVRVPAPVTCLKFSPDGVYIGVACTDKTAKIMQLDDKVGMRDVQTVQQGGATTPKLNSMCWHPQAPQFCFCGQDKIVDVWDVRASRPALKVTTLGGNLNIDWSPDGNFLAVGNRDDLVGVVDVRKGGAMVQKVKFGVEINELAWSANSDHLMLTHGGSGSGGLKVLQWGAVSNQIDLVYDAPAHASPCLGLCVDKNYSKMAIGSTDMTVSLWDLEDLVSYKTIAGFDNTVTHMSFNGDGSLLAACAEESRALSLFDTLTGDIRAILTGSSKPIGALDWNPCRPLIATALAVDKKAGVSGNNTYMHLVHVPAAE